MAEESESPLDDFHSTRVVDDIPDVRELAGEGIAGERIDFREILSVASDSASRKIEGDRRQSVLGERTGEVRKECPVGKSLEPVTDDHRSDRCSRGIHLAPDEKSIRTRDVERFRTCRADFSHPSTSPLISAQP